MATMIEDRPSELGSEHRPPPGLSRGKFGPVDDQPDLPEEAVEKFEFVRKKVPELAESVESEIAAERERLAADGRYTEDGVKEKLAEFKEELAGRYLNGKYDGELPGGGLAHLRLVAQKMKRKALKEKEKMPLYPEADPNDARAAQREKELRERLEAVDDGQQRMELARTLAESGDAEALRALFDAPGGLSPLNEGYRATLMKRAMDAQHGEQWRRAERMMDAATSAEQVLDRLEHYFTETLGT